MRVLDLFSGIGGFSLGLSLAGPFRTVQFVELDPWCRAVLAKNFPGVPIHDDIRTFHPADGLADIVVGGFPCQPFSHAGKRGGARDDRDLWPEMARVIAAARPRWVIGENVAGFVSMELDRSLSDLEALGYTCQTFNIPACAVGAPHRRERVWIVAHRDGWRCEGERLAEHGQQQGACRGEPDGLGAGRRRPGPAVAHADGPRLGAVGRSGRHRSRDAGPHPDDGGQAGAVAGDRGLPDGGRGPARAATERPGHGDSACRWSPEPGVGRVADGIPRRVDRLRGLGNAVVPQVVAEIGRAIMAADGQA